MGFIKLTVEKKNGVVLTAPVVMGFETSDIISPIRNNGTNSYFTVRTIKGVSNSSRDLGHVNYSVSESLAAIILLSPELFLASVIEANLKAVSYDAVFVVEKAIATLTTVTTGTQFYYAEDGNPNSVSYIVRNSIANIVLQNNFTPGDPMIYTALISQLAPVASTPTPTMDAGQIWTLEVWTNEDLLSYGFILVSGVLNAIGSKYLVTTSGAYAFGDNTEFSYDGSPYVVSTNANGDIVPYIDTIGDVVFSYDSTGVFVVASAFFNTGKVFCYIQPTYDSVTETFLSREFYWDSTNYRIVTGNINTGAGHNSSFVDGLLYRTPIEIRVYP